MKNLLKLIMILLFFFYLSTIAAQAESYPEYTGNYIDCGGKWCEMTNNQLNVMMIQEKSADGWRFLTYPGYFEIPKEAVKLITKKPRILLYSGRQGADPRTAALIELNRLPYNNAPIYEVDRKSYKGQVKYCKNDTNNEMWVFKREIPLRYKPIDGKMGMFIYEPTESLSDGFYVIDSGIAKASGHDGLSTQPGYFDFYKTSHAIAALTFVIGKIEDVQPAKSLYENSKDSLGKTAPEDTAKEAPPTNDAGKAFGDMIKGLFK